MRAAFASAPSLSSFFASGAFTAMGKKYVQVADHERDLLKTWKKDGKTLTDMMAFSGRSKATVITHTRSSTKGSGSGRRKIITSSVRKKVMIALLALQKQAYAKKEITVAMVTKRAKVNACARQCLTISMLTMFGFAPNMRRVLNSCMGGMVLP